MSIMNPKVYRLSEDGEYWEMLPEILVKYKQCLDIQLQKWLSGENVHTTNLPEGIEYECCPDMSCCVPEAAWPLEMRQQFANASDEDRTMMMFTGLSSIINDDKVYISGNHNTTH